MRLLGALLLYFIILFPTNTLASQEHVIAEGETLFGLTADSWDLRERVLEDIQAANPNLNIDRVREGEMVTIPESPWDSEKTANLLHDLSDIRNDVTDLKIAGLEERLSHANHAVQGVTDEFDRVVAERDAASQRAERAEGERDSARSQLSTLKAEMQTSHKDMFKASTARKARDPSLTPNWFFIVGVAVVVAIVVAMVRRRSQ
ncbi:MAG: hypothetical protein O2794_03060 [bacterium]|nr:hypothetical protein [bacterium]